MDVRAVGLVLCLRHPWNWGPGPAATWVPGAAGGCALGALTRATGLDAETDPSMNDSALSP